MATIKDVASAAGVSVSTVSYAFNGKRPISEEAKKRILKIAEELNYSGGQGLYERKAKLIGLFGLNIDAMGYNTYVNQILMGILSVLQKTGYRVVFLPEGSREDKMKSTDNSLPLHGAIVIEPKRDEDYYGYFKEQKIPFVLIGRPGNNAVHVNYVDVDNVSLGYRSVKYFLDRKQNNILFINGPKNLTVCEDREKGYRLAFEEMGITEDFSRVINTDMSIQETFEVVTRLYEKEKPFSAIIGFSELQVIGALNALIMCGYSCPKDVSLFCCSETFISTNINPPITGMDSCASNIGVQAANLMLKLIRKELITASHISLPAILNERSSVL